MADFAVGVAATIIESGVAISFYSFNALQQLCFNPKLTQHLARTKWQHYDQPNQPDSPMQQLRHQRVDVLGDAGGGERFADAAAGGLEVEIVGNGDFGGDLLSLGTGGGKFGV